VVATVANGFGQAMVSTGVVVVVAHKVYLLLLVREW
jgi:hypothetical protein